MLFINTKKPQTGRQVIHQMCMFVSYYLFVIYLFIFTLSFVSIYFVVDYLVRTSTKNVPELLNCYLCAVTDLTEVSCLIMILFHEIKIIFLKHP